mgnify:CR=1 FL=1
METIDRIKNNGLQINAISYSMMKLLFMQEPMWSNGQIGERKGSHHGHIIGCYPTVYGQQDHNVKTLR